MRARSSHQGDSDSNPGLGIVCEGELFVGTFGYLVIGSQTYLLYERGKICRNRIIIGKGGAVLGMTIDSILADLHITFYP